MTCDKAKYGAFAMWARHFFECGVSVTPTLGKDGKVPLLSGYQRKRLGPEAIDAIAKRTPDANIGIVTGLSKLAVVDVDEPYEKALADALYRFGPSPLISRTGRGRFQAYYKGHPALRPHDFRHSENKALELKVDGNIVIAPPSVNFETGGVYEFIEGRIEDVASLPVINMAGVPQLAIRLRREGRRISEDARRMIEIGERNDWLFRQCLRHAAACDDFATLLDVALTRADEHFGEPMSEAEIKKTAMSAWGYEQRGENWVGSHARLPLTLDQLLSLEALCNADALILALHLQLEHGGRMGRGETFALDTRAMAASGTIQGWSRSRYWRALDCLVQASILKVVRQGWGGVGGKGCASQYIIDFPSQRRAIG